MGVTSRIMLTRRPAAVRARSADSRPAPGPFTYTETKRTPCSIAFFAQSSAAVCAAKGVDLREPLKPCWPQLDQESALPAVSVIVTTVLLNVDWMCATPAATFFLTFFLAPLAMLCLASPSHFLTGGFFLPATVRTGPLRVRALVWVRCPRTGSPRRWRSPR